MRRRHWYVDWLVASCAAIACLTCSGQAFAYHDDKQRITNGTAYTLGDDYRWKIGLWEAKFAIFSRLDVSIYPLPWLFMVSNLGLKYEYRLSDAVSFGTKLHAFRLDVQKLNEKIEPVKIEAIPAELNASFRWGDFTNSLQMIFSYIHVQGSMEEDALRGAAAISNLQFVDSFEYRWTRVTALWLRVRYLAYQWQPSASARYVLHPDDYTTVEVHGAAEVDMFDVSHAYSIVPGVQFSWESYNLRLGLGYGNYNLGPVNFVVPQKTLVPEFDMFWRW